MGKLKADDPSVKEVLRLFFAGVGAGRVGLRTLSAVIEDLKSANITEVDGATLRKFMCYSGGDENGERRMSVSARREFHVDVALGVAEGKITVRKGAGGGAGGTGSGTAAEDEEGAGSGAGGKQKRVAGGSGSGGARGATSAPEQGVDLSAISGEVEKILGQMQSLYVNLPPPSSISKFKGIMNESFFGAFGVSNFKEMAALYKEVQTKFGVAYNAGRAAMYEAKGGNAEEFSKNFGQAAASYQDYLGAVSAYKMKVEQYDMGFSQYFSRALDAATLFAIPYAAGSVVVAARGGVGLAQAGKAAVQILLSKAAWKKAVIASATMSGLFTGAEVLKTYHVNKAMDEFVKDPEKSINDLRVGLEKYRKQLETYSGVDKQKLSNSIDAATQSLSQAESMLENARANSDWKAVAVYFGQSFATFMVFEMGFRALGAAARVPGEEVAPGGQDATQTASKPTFREKAKHGWENVKGVFKKKKSSVPKIVPEAERQFTIAEGTDGTWIVTPKDPKVEVAVKDSQGIIVLKDGKSVVTVNDGTPTASTTNTCPVREGDIITVNGKQMTVKNGEVVELPVEVAEKPGKFKRAWDATKRGFKAGKEKVKNKFKKSETEQLGEKPPAKKKSVVQKLGEGTGKAMRVHPVGRARDLTLGWAGRWFEVSDTPFFVRKASMSEWNVSSPSKSPLEIIKADGTRVPVDGTVKIRAGEKIAVGGQELTMRNDGNLFGTDGAKVRHQRTLKRAYRAFKEGLRGEETPADTKIPLTAKKSDGVALDALKSDEGWKVKLYGIFKLKDDALQFTNTGKNSMQAEIAGVKTPVAPGATVELHAKDIVYSNALIRQRAIVNDDLSLKFELR